MPRKYGPKASKSVGRAMHKMKRGKLQSGKSGRKVKNPKQAIAIGLSEARQKGAKVPPKKTSRSSSDKGSSTSRSRSSSSKSPKKSSSSRSQRRTNTR
jgi:hypothetical protein